MPNIPVASVDRSDLSIQFFDRIFGPGWEAMSSMLSDPMSVASGSAPSMVYAIMEHFNAVALVAMTVLWAWIGVQGALGSAHEGTPLGKRFHSLWVPMRMAFAAAGLAPVFKGLSLVQVLVLTAIGFSVQTANYVWEKGLDFFVESGGQVVLSVPAVMEQHGQTLGSGILRSLTIQMWRIERQGESFPSDVYETSFRQGENTTAGSKILSFATPTACENGDCGLAPGAFGSIEIPCRSASDSMCIAREAAIQEMTGILVPLAQRLASFDTVPRSEQLKTMDIAVHTYTQRMVAALREGVSEAQASLHSDLQTFRENGKLRGWSMAGSYYWTITRLNEKALEGLYDDTIYHGPDERKFARGMLPEFEGLDASVKALAAEQIGAAQAGADDSGLGWLRQQVNEMFSISIVNSFTRAIASTDIIAAFAGLGHTIIATFEAFLALILAISLAGSFGGGFVSSAIGAGASIAGKLAGGSLLSALSFLAPGFWAASLALLVLGFMFAFYIPALPYILWISGLIGWTIVVVEAVVAAPLWIVVHSLPEGEGIAGQRAQQGYGLLLGILLRPPLMVAGMLMAFAMIQGLGPLVGYTFQIFHVSLGSDHVMGIAHIFAMLTILCSLMVIMSHKMFGLISWLPDQVIRWIGGSMPSLGETGDESRARVIFGAIGSKSEGLMGVTSRGFAKPSGAKGLKETPGGTAGGDNEHKQGQIKANLSGNSSGEGI